MAGVCTIPRHVPPELVVDFDIYDMAGEPADFHMAWHRLQLAHPEAELLFTTRNEGHWIAMRGDSVLEAYGNPALFSNRMMLVPKSRGRDVALLPTMLDPPEHTPLRAIINPNLAPRAIQRIEPMIRAIAVEAIEAFRADGRCEFIADYAEILPIRVFMALVDLPMADVPTLKDWARQLNQPSGEHGEMSVKEIMGAFADYLRPFVEARRRMPSDDMLSRLANGTRDGEPISVEEAIEMITLVMLGGLDTVASFVGFLVLFLARNPEHRRRLVADPTLIPAAVDELMRRFAINVNTREVREDVSYKGVALRSGDLIVMPTILHSLDDREFDDPLAVDFGRTITRVATFGAGPHRCPGSFLARTEMRITLEEWLARIPDYELEPGVDVKMRSGIVATIVSLPLRWQMYDEATTSAAHHG